MERLPRETHVSLAMTKMEDSVSSTEWHFFVTLRSASKLKNMTQKKKVLVWLSGWVDSAVVAHLLLEQGYDVTAGFMINYYTADDENCTTKKDLEVAKEVAEYLKIPFFTFDYVAEYEKIILDYIYEWYKQWITPNPDVFCNSEVKFKIFLDEALELGFDYIATGHYARIEETSSSNLKNLTPIPSPQGEEGTGIREGYLKTPGYVKTLAKDLRKDQTKAEDIFWDVARNRQIEWLKFRRQSPFGRYIADFYCSEISLVIELDGKIHENQQEYDEIRDDIISKYGVNILRVKNEEIFENLQWVIQKIIDLIPSPLRRGVGWGYSSSSTSSPTLLHEEKGVIYHLLKWVDPSKDQSYFLSFLNQDQLSRSLFPIGHLQKSEVREIAERIWLPNAKRKDSQWLCFVGKVDFEEFLKKKLPVEKWNIVDENGKVLWEHDGVYFYTIGQRKWLNIGWLKEPVFVIGKNIAKNELIVWTENAPMLYGKTLTTKNIHFVADKLQFPVTGKAKIRYRQTDQEVVVKKEWGNYLWEFQEQQRAISAGQIASLYIGDELVMSGVIE